MSDETRLAPRAYGDAQDGAAQKGSVRAARERMQAAQMRSQLPDTSRIIGLPQRPNQLVSQFSANRNDDSQPKTPTGRRNEGSMVSPPPQWPLPDDASPTVPPRSPNRLRPHQRPQQPTIRPISDDYPIQQPSPGSPPPLSPDYLQPPSFNFRISNKSDDMYSPSSRPFSGASEASSLGSIPDFPVPQPPMPTVQPLSRRVPSLGPPPSSRRGPSSYYTQMSYVSPIVEESETRSNTIRSRHGSFASSNVFPTYGDDYYQNDYPQSDDDETITSDRGTMSPASDHDDQSGLVKEPPALVRQASLGRRSKPSLMTIKSVDSIGEKKNGTSKKAMAGVGIGAAGVGGIFAARDAAQSSPLRSSIMSSGTGLMDPSSSSSSESFSTFRNTKSTSPSYTGAESPIFPFQPEPRTNTLADRVGFRRPPRLDMDTVRDAEARGSLTSLPELIRRATRLAANLDRGRTASRLGLDFWESGAPEQKNARKSQNSLSDMLAAFPPPGQETPQRSGTPAGNAMAEWPSSGGAATRSGGVDQGIEKPAKRRRRCCGLPLWTFITLLIVLLFIIAAAVIIPIVLVVIPNQNKSTGAAQDSQGNNNNNNPPSAPAPTSSPGSGSSICQNGGVAIQNADQSSTCVCINGFTGSTCGNNDESGCTTTSVMGTANNATVGSGVPRLVQSAAEDFNVPLDATRILSLFSSLSLSCAAENALITFNGLTSRSTSSKDQSINLGSSLLTRSLPLLHPTHPARQVQARQDATPISSNTTAVDFARIGVLFALQQDGKLDAAATAQENVQEFLTNNRNGNSNTNTVDLGPFTMDLVKLTIKFDNGTIIGPK